MKEKRTWFFLPVMILLILVMGMLLVGVGKGLWVKMLLDRVWEQEHLICDIHMEAPETLDDVSIDWTGLGQQRYFTVHMGAQQLYLHDEKVFFSNGSGYDLEGFLDDLDIPGGLLGKLPLLVPVQRNCSGVTQIWEYALSGEPPFLLRTLFPESRQYWAQLQNLKISLIEESGWISEILIRHGSLSLRMELRQEKPDPIPTELLIQMGTRPLPDIRTLEPLVRACLKLDAQAAADVSIQVDCGPLPIQDSGTLRLSEDGLYFSRGEVWTELTPESVNRKELLAGLCWMLIHDGVWNPEGTDSGAFTLTIPSTQLKSSLLSILPELDGLDFTLDNGTVSVFIEENKLTEVHLSCTGQMPFLITTVPLSIQMELTVTG